jgi:hypothetical protein
MIFNALTGADAMGESNSTVTRVWPVFDCLFHRDPTGASWLKPLLELGPRAALLDQKIRSDPGNLCPELSRIRRPLTGPLKEVLGPTLTEKIGSIRNAYEAEFPPPAAFLRWMLEHPERLRWPEWRGKRLEFSPATQDKRTKLLACDTAVRAEGLKELSSVGAEGSRHKWWAFEGFTSVDCKLETQSLLLFIEGKRTEPISESTDWFPGRNQVIRNLEVAQALIGGQKNFAVLICAESEIKEFTDKTWTGSLPHLGHDAIESLQSHYLGTVRWSVIAERLCGGLKLPSNLDEAINTSLQFR